MNILTLLQSALAFIIGVISLYLVYKLLNIYLKRVFKIDVINPAYATLQAGIVLSTALLISSIIGPGLNAIRFLNQDVVTAQTIAGSMGYVIMFLVIGMIFSFMVIAGGILVLFQLTHVNEWEEIRNSNHLSSINFRASTYNERSCSHRLRNVNSLSAGVADSIEDAFWHISIANQLIGA